MTGDPETPRLVIARDGTITEVVAPVAFGLGADVRAGMRLDAVTDGDSTTRVRAAASRSLEPVPTILLVGGERRSVVARRRARDDASVVIEPQDRQAFGLLTATIAELNSEVQRRRRAEQRLRTTLDTTVADLEQTNEDLQSFLYIASHDLAEPLRTISAYTALLLEMLDVDPDGDEHRYAAYVTGAVARMKTLLEGLLRSSQVEMTDLERTTVDLHATVVSIVDDDLRDTLDDAPTGTTIVVRPPDASVECRGIEVLARTALSNLLVNAVKYGDPDRDNEIVVEFDHVGDTVEVHVGDRGVGIAPSHAAGVFEPFRRGTSGERASGSGIGLTIARRAARRMGGDIRHEQRQDGGSRFVLSLPRVQAA